MALTGKGTALYGPIRWGGGSESGERVGWKIFHERDMKGLAVLPHSFQGPRPGYNRADQLFARIEAQL